MSSAHNRITSHMHTSALRNLTLWCPLATDHICLNLGLSPASRAVVCTTCCCVHHVLSPASRAVACITCCCLHHVLLSGCRFVLITLHCATNLLRGLAVWGHLGLRTHTAGKASLPQGCLQTIQSASATAPSGCEASLTHETQSTMLLCSGGRCSGGRCDMFPNLGGANVTGETLLRCRTTANQ